MVWASRQPNFYLQLPRNTFGRAQLPYKSDAEKLCDRPLMPVIMMPTVVMTPSIVVPGPVVARSIVVISRRVVVARPIVIRSKWRSGDSARGIDRDTGDTERPFQGKGAVLSVGR